MSYSDYEAESDEEEITADQEKDEVVDPLMEDMVNACKYGNFNKVKELVEKEDPDFVQRIDKEGHTFLHWAALAGNNDLIEYLLDKGVPLNEHSRNDYGPRPIHWACVHGNVKTIDLMLDKGVPIDTTDRNGCTPLIVAAQYGQSLAISYLLQKGANKFHVDVNGDTALHWAAFKGYPEVVFLLLNAGLSATQKDAYAQTPLHSACIKGDIQCAEMLLEHGAVVDDPDSNGKTPRVLATGRRHRMLVKFLDTRDTTNFWDWRTIVFGPPSRNRYAVIFFIVAMLVWAYPFYFIRILPMSMEEHYNIHLTFWIISIFMWILFVWVKFSDPGYIKQNRQAYEDAVRMIGNPAAWGDYTDMNNPMYNICHTCKTVRPVRAKHCRQCNKCVEVFDHHCPWIDNCVGVKNRVLFSIFLIVLGVCGLFSIYFLWELIREQGMDGWIFIGILLLSVFFLSGFFQITFMFNMIISNITTNEKANYTRYRHFKKEDGSFHNPFDRGVFYNCLEYWHLTKPLGAARMRKHTHIV